VRTIATAALLAAVAVPGIVPDLVSDLDVIFGASILDRAVVGVCVESLRDGRVVYARQSGTHVVPASNLKLVTMAVAAERLGWDFRFETRLETAAAITDGRLAGDLVVVGTGDPGISAPDGRPSSVFVAWAAALWDAGVRRIDGRIIGDDNAFDDEGLGAGWAWDYLGAGYATPTGALVYNENVTVVRAQPGAAAGDPVSVTLAPAGHGLELVNQLRTGAAGSAVSIDLVRPPGDARLTIAGSVPAGGTAVVRTAAVDNPTTYFVEALRQALLERGIVVRDGAWDIDAVPAGSLATGARRVLVRRESAPLADLAGYFLKASQNLYGETMLKAIGRGTAPTGAAGSAERGRAAIRESLAAWGIPADAVVMYDGSGLSRYNYVTADAIVAILKRVWANEATRGPFLAALPVGGHDGTLSLRMRKSPIAGRVQAKTGSIANVRALSGFLEAASGERFVFSMIANHYTAPNAEIDAVMERALERIAR
jgi:D-alanyl-D-alanine carboxypeptidase/D-alanyl-D-alanine-endopeptidase (penicillin-binding protein 4)